MKQPNIRQFKAWCRENASLAEAVCLATAFAQIERERVDAYIQPIFARYEFWTDMEAEHGGARERITSHDQLYLSKDEALCRAYFDECDAAHRANGFEGKKDFCPALIADTLRIDAENALLESGCELFGIEMIMLYGGEHRQKMLDLLLGASLKAAKEAA